MSTLPLPVIPDNPNISLYYLIEFYPTNMRDEKINVGVVGTGKGGTRVRCISDEAWGRIATWTMRPHPDTFYREVLDELVRDVLADPTIAIPRWQPRIYHCFVIHRQGSSLDGTDESLDHFFECFCCLAEGKPYRWLTRPTSDEDVPAPAPQEST